MTQSNTKGPVAVAKVVGRGRLAGAALLAAVALVGGFEGMKTEAYLDIVRIPTICFGHTKGVQLGDTATPAQCKELLAEELQVANDAVNRCIKYPLGDNQRVALVSLTYNAGPKAVCGSTIQREFNAGHPEAGCAGILKWKYAGGKVVKGLERRRNEEYQLCTTPDGEQHE